MPATNLTAQNKQLRGLALPAFRRAGGYFAVSDKYDVAWGDLLITLFCPGNGRPMKRNFGSALHLLIMEPNDGMLGQLALYAVRDAVGRWCPHIEIRDVNVRRDAETLSITIAFSLAEDAAIQERSTQLSFTEIAGLAV